MALQVRRGVAATRTAVEHGQGGQPPGSSRVFAFLLLLSGFCGISYEILYGRILGNLIGDQFAVSASILLTFLLGIGFGTLYAHRLWRWLWLLEAGIGLCGIAFALGGDALDALLFVALPLLGPGLGSSVLLCFLLLSVPSFLIGTSLPLFAGYLARLRPGRVFARAYTIYNFGAALTALLIEFALLRWLGLKLAVLSIASLNFVVAAALLVGYGGIRQERPRPADAADYPAHHLAALALASVASAAFQLLMVKLAECFLGPFRETFALVLALILLGIAVGSALTARLQLGFGHVVLAALAGLAWLLAGFAGVTRLYAALYAQAVDVYPAAVLFKLVTLGLLMGVPAMAFGATIPALLTEQRNVARESGRLLFVSSVANATGFLLMAFVLHRYLDYGAILLVVFALGALALVVYRRSLDARAVGVALLVPAAFLVHRAAWDEKLLYVGHTSFQRPQALSEALGKLDFARTQTFKGFQDTFSINWSDGEPFFYINGYVSIHLDSPAEKLVGAFSSIFAPRTDRALVLGLGSGATGGTVSLLFDELDAVEINPVVLENLYRMSEWNFDIVNHERVNVIPDDAIHFVKTTDRTYSLIINTVTTPLYFSSSKLYTRDFLERARERLTPDGVYVTWMDARVGDRGADIIVRTVSEVFEDCWIGTIEGSYHLLLCSRQPVVAHRPGLIASHDTLRRYFETNLLPPDWLPYALLTNRLHEIADAIDAPANTLDYPALEFAMARAVTTRGIPRFHERLRRVMTLEDLERALAPRMDWDPLHLALYTDVLLDDDRELHDHWRAQVAQRTPDFEQRYAEETLRYHADLAAAADTGLARHNYGFELMQRGRFDEARAQLERAVELGPHPGTWFNLGYVYEMQGDLERALETYPKELVLDPGDAEVPFRRGIVLLELKRHAEALREFDQAIALDDRPQYFFGRGQALVGLRMLGEARTAFQESLRRDPDYEDARRAIERLNAIAG